MLAVASAALMPLMANSQIAPDKPPAQPAGPTYKYQAFVGWGYTSINQVNGSRSGLQGVDASVTRNWGKYFGLTAQGGHYAWPLSSANMGNPTVDLFLAGPEFHAQLYDNLSGFVHGMMGVAHTGGISIAPSASFAGGLGLGMDYSIKPRLALRLSGDDIGSSFTLVPYQSGYSPHRRWNAHASFGVVYKF